MIATKYSAPYKSDKGENYITINRGRNGAKSMRLSLEASLRKLQTAYVDILYVYWRDYATSTPELMQGLDDLVTSGKVLFLGISDTPGVDRVQSKPVRAYGRSAVVCGVPGHVECCDAGF